MWRVQRNVQYCVACSCLQGTTLLLLGFVGLLDALILLPLVLIWHYTGVEYFELPPTNEVWTLLLVNGFVGTVLSELLWLL